MDATSCAGKAVVPGLTTYVCCKNHNGYEVSAVRFQFGGGTPGEVNMHRVKCVRRKPANTAAKPESQLLQQKKKNLE